MTRIGIDPIAVLQQMDRGPVEALVERAPLIERLMLGILNVGHELGPLGGHDRLKLGGDFARRSLERRHPREQPAWVKLALDQARIMKVRRLAVIGVGPPQDVVAKAIEPVTQFVVGALFGVAHGRAQLCVALVLPGRNALLALRNHLRQARRKLARGLLGDRVRPRFRGGQSPSRSSRLARINSPVKSRGSIARARCTLASASSGWPVAR